MTTMSTSRPSTTPMMDPVITPAWMGTVGGGEEEEKRRGVLEGRTEENDAENLRIERRKSRNNRQKEVGSVQKKKEGMNKEKT